MINSEILPFLYNFIWTGQEYKSTPILQHIKTDLNLYSPIPFYGEKLWEGEDLTNKSLLIYSDQGIGDYIQFARYLIDLKDRYDTEISVLLNRDQYKALHRLKTIGGNEKLLDKLDCEKTYDYFINLVSIPFYLYKIQYNYPPFSDEIKAKIPYFKVEYNEKYKELGTKWKIKIGTKWQSRKDGEKHDKKSVTQKEIEKLSEFGELYNLDNSEVDSYVIHNMPIQDLYDVAQYMLEMDVVVSVDTATLHLAGALGLNAIGLFNKDLYWRWQGVNNFYPTITPCFNIKEVKEEILA